MPDIFITDDEARGLLRAYVFERGRGAVTALAEKTGLSRSSVSEMVSGKRVVHARDGSELGLTAVRGFVRARETDG